MCFFTSYSLNQATVVFACLSRNSTLKTIPAVQASAHEAHRLPKKRKSWEAIPCEGDVPTPEEWLKYAVEKLEENKSRNTQAI